jgi:hypothetical protein
MLAACGARPAHRTPQVEHSGGPPVQHAPVHRVVTAPRPDLPIAIDVPDLSEELRWPLSIVEHPNLEPHYPVARVLAEPGISWTDLCARGVQNRRDPSHKDELAYLGGWCAALKHDTSEAITTLAPLMHASNMELASSVPFDIAFIVAANEDADHADKILRGSNVKQPEVWDLIAASYYEVSKDSDALYATSTARQLDPKATDAVSCHRLARQLLLGSSAYREGWLDQLKGLAAHKMPAQSCVELSVSVPCVVARECHEYLVAQNVPELQIELFDALQHWPNVGDQDMWMAEAWRARRAWPAEGSVRLVEAAVDAAVASVPCASVLLEDLAISADDLSVGIPPLNAKAAWVHKMRNDERACEDFHQQWDKR